MTIDAASMNAAPRADGARKPLLIVAILALAAVSGCVGDGGPRPTTPTYTGNQRPDPSRPPTPDAPQPGTTIADPFAGSGPYRPRHLGDVRSRDIQRVAVLLPFSSTNQQVSELADSLFNAMQMSLFETGAQNVVLMPMDASGSTEDVARLAAQAIDKGAVAVLGPVFGQQIPAVSREVQASGAPVFSFSTDSNATGQGAYLMSLTPNAEVDRIVEWAIQKGVTRFAMLGPNSAYGYAVDRALRQATTRYGGLVIAAEFYPPGATTPTENAQRLAEVVKTENEAYPGQVAVLIPERGVQLRSVASLLPYFDVDQRQVQFLGTGAWNDPEVWREPSLRGGVFAAPDASAIEDFMVRYQATFGSTPSTMTSFGHDAGALVATLAVNDRLDRATVETRDGWLGVNGLFRFLADGSAERELSVMQVQNDGSVRTIAPAAQSFAPGS